MSFNAQQLANTTWNVYDTGGNLFVIATFDTDSLRFDSNPKFTQYNENGANFWLFDNFSLSTACNNDTGSYTFIIQNDTLSFTTATDPCAVRVTAIQDYTWVDITASLNDNNHLASLKIYPNPTSGKLSITLDKSTSGTIYIRNAVGQLVLQENLIDIKEHVIQLNAPAGIYFLQLESDGQVITKKIVKQ